jgi:ubiquinone/menaquinone biosynthesis C-methylase UbiE
MDKTKIAIAAFNNCAKRYQDKFMEMDLYHDTFDLFCAAIKKKNATVLELACGPGNITKYLLRKRPDFRILATDLSENMLELAARNNPTAEFQLLDCRAIANLEKKYDAVLCGFGLPYLSKAESLTFIHDVYEILNPNGVFYISTMEGDASKSGFKRPSSGEGDEIYIHYHQADYLIDSLTGNNFEILELIRKDYPEEKDATIKDLILLAKKKKT